MENRKLGQRVETRKKPAQSGVIRKTPMEQGSGREPILEGQIGIEELYQRCKCRKRE